MKQISLPYRSRIYLPLYWNGRHISFSHGPSQSTSISRGHMSIGFEEPFLFQLVFVQTLIYVHTMELWIDKPGWERQLMIWSIHAKFRICSRDNGRLQLTILSNCERYAAARVRTESTARGGRSYFVAEPTAREGREQISSQVTRISGRLRVERQ